MTNLSSVADRYVGVWNEPDPSARSATIRELWAPGAVHAMKSIVARGHAELEARITGSHEKNIAQNGFHFRRTGRLEAVRDAVKFGWEMVRAGTSDVESSGIGIVVLGDDGRITADYLFVDW